MDALSGSDDTDDTDRTDDEADDKDIPVPMLFNDQCETSAFADNPTIAASESHTEDAAIAASESHTQIFCKLCFHISQGDPPAARSSCPRHCADADACYHIGRCGCFNRFDSLPPLNDMLLARRNRWDVHRGRQRFWATRKFF